MIRTPEELARGLELHEAEQTIHHAKGVVRSVIEGQAVYEAFGIPAVYTQVLGQWREILSDARSDRNACLRNLERAKLDRPMPLHGWDWPTYRM